MTAMVKAWTDIAAPLLVDNIDTDTIIPSREMRTTGRDGLADGLFAPWRYDKVDERIESPDFVLNQPQYRGTSILLGGANFGCGSSREHAVWALAEWGIRAIIAESFAPIFYGNCIRNWVLPIALPPNQIKLFAGKRITIDLVEQKVRFAGQAQPFEIDSEAKLLLLNGLDAIDLTLGQISAIDSWTSADRKSRPWVYLKHRS